jgi:hypothetical protein
MPQSDAFKATLCFLLLAMAGVAAPVGAAGCPPPAWPQEQLQALRDLRPLALAPADQGGLALQLLPCLASPDPELRDRLGFELLSRLLREGQVDTDIRLQLTTRLLPQLAVADRYGVTAPFAALTLAELVRADRIDPFMPAALRVEVAEAAIHFLDNTHDYRGFDARVGWRHRVAHGADLIAQLARNPAVDDPALLLRLRNALGRQVRPKGHFYVYGEPQRLAAATMALAQRGYISAGQWTVWFEAVAAPAPLRSWPDAFNSQQGLADRHNLSAFLQAVWIGAQSTGGTDDDVLLAGAGAALQRVP